jgi:hypothetical protein
MESFFERVQLVRVRDAAPAWFPIKERLALVIPKWRLTKAV